MGEIIDLNVQRESLSEVCGRCNYPDFCIVDDRDMGLIVVCQHCGAVNGILVTDDN